ncbi:aminopeptidase [Mycobacterium botniense]|uniref:Aminopeptidase n=1 Tax=Mycobacterium botniense TaxID=84962 RepID=A0A7I9Y0C8_9MYCO|nr:aminopeptidase [Mycobacterium botniense]GFG75518.1 hypothetical protein MBOT_28830 [Mycobacterium botniense]
MGARRVIVIIGAAVLAAGLIGLFLPVSVSGGGSGSIGCGNAVASNLSSAQSANNQNPANLPIVSQLVPHTDYVAECQSSLSSRRAWSIPLTIAGVIAAGGALLVRRPRGTTAREL